MKEVANFVGGEGETERRERKIHEGLAAVFDRVSQNEEDEIKTLEDFVSQAKQS